MNIQDANLRVAKSMSTGNNPNKIIIHHPEWNGSVTDLNEMMISMGYSMIGYNFYIRKDGSVWYGRPVQYIGANCYGQNDQSIGISFEGNFDKDFIGQAQFDAGVELIKYLKATYGISEVGPHYNYSSTECPGKNFPVVDIISAANNGSYSAPANNNIISSNSGYDSVIDRAAAYLGQRVTEVQTKLSALGLYTGSIDGIFGKLTFQAIKDFQSLRGLSVDGFCGPVTFAELNSNNYTLHQEASIEEKRKLQEAINIYNDDNDLDVDGKIGGFTLSAIDKIYIRRSTVRYALNGWIQSRLLSLGYSIGASGVDKYFGEATENAVIAFQEAHGLTADGIVGPITLKKLISC